MTPIVGEDLGSNPSQSAILQLGRASRWLATATDLKPVEPSKP